MGRSTAAPNRLSMHFGVEDLRLFVNIAEAQNLTRGAKRAFLSPAAASVRLKALEEQLGSRLFYRDNRGVTLTAAGHTLLHHAHLVLRQIEHIKSEFVEYGTDGSGHIRIFANTTAVTQFLPEILADFLATRPGVTVDVQERLNRAITRGVHDGAADLGITAGPMSTPELDTRHFNTDRLVIVTPWDHPLARHQRVAFADTLGYEHISLHEGSTLHAFICEQSELHGRPLPMRTQVRSFEAMCRMIEAGVGISVMPESAVKRHQHTMRLANISIADAWAMRERFILARDMQALPGCARALIDAIVAQFENSSYA